MLANPIPAITDVLIIGRALVFRELVGRLRMAGRSTWVATSILDVHWLMNSARIRPAMAVVELPTDPSERADLVHDLLEHRRLSHIPVVLVGANPGENIGLPNTCTAVPFGATAEEIEGALAQQ
jgi:hypothetical protein